MLKQLLLPYDVEMPPDFGILACEAVNLGLRQTSAEPGVQLARELCQLESDANAGRLQ